MTMLDLLAMEPAKAAPIPERNLIFGKALPRDRSLLSYRLPPAEARTEEGFLRDRLWLSRTEDSE